MKIKLIPSLIFGAMAIVILVMPGDHTPESFNNDVTEIYMEDSDGVLNQNESSEYMKNIDAILNEIENDCDDLNVQSLEQYKELRTLFIFFKEDKDSIYDEVIVINENSKKKIDLAVKALSDTMIEICK